MLSSFDRHSLSLISIYMLLFKNSFGSLRDILYVVGHHHCNWWWSRIGIKIDIVSTSFVKHVSNLGIKRELLSNPGKFSIVSSMALFDVAFISRVWNLSSIIFGLHKKFVDNADHWITVFVNPELSKTLRISLDGQVPMVLHVMAAHKSNFGCSVADTCCKVQMLDRI